MNSISVEHLINLISALPKNRSYRYVYSGTPSLIEIQYVDLPSGPIKFKRYNPTKGESSLAVSEETISTEMIARVANAFRPNQPINFDRVLGASYNSRSVLEALIAHLPEFYYCYPGRIDPYTQKIASGHKHLIWCPDDPHEFGVLEQRETEIVISEVPTPTIEVAYEALHLPEYDTELDIDVQRRHAQIQIALVLIGQHLGYHIWVAQNDWSIQYNNVALREMNGVIHDLANIPMLSAPEYRKAREDARLIDCIWFMNTRFMPAVMEIEHSTGVTSGLNRMLTFRDNIPSIGTHYLIMAADEDRKRVSNEIHRSQFRALNAKFFPYSAVEELLWLCSRRPLKDVGPNFIESFIEKI